MKDYGTFVSTAKANLAVSTAPCSFIGISVYASAACTITVADGANVLLGPVILAATQTRDVFPCRPIACGELSVTNSGGGYYTVFYGNR